MKPLADAADTVSRATRLADRVHAGKAAHGFEPALVEGDLLLGGEDGDGLHVVARLPADGPHLGEDRPDGGVQAGVALSRRRADVVDDQDPPGLSTCLAAAKASRVARWNGKTSPE